MKLSRRWTTVLFTACCLGAWGSASAQSANFPSRAITMVVPFPPGGLADIVARPVAEAMSRDLGQPVVIENKPGAGGGIGMGLVAKAKPDGYTVVMALSSFSVIPEADVIVGRAPMFGHGDLKAIARYTADPTVLAVRADSPWKTVKDFVEDAKKKPKAINYGSSGNYGTMHIPMEMLAQTAGIQLMHVPYTGAGPAVLALLGGQIEAVSTGPATVLQHVKAGKIRVLGHWGNARLESMPDVPSLKDSGYATEYAQWSGLFIPAATPEPIAQRLRAAARFAANDARVKEIIQNAGSPVLFLDSADFEKYVQADVRRMVEVVRKIGKVE
ncbi:MAG: hypothetical protein RL307_601 [Pseudomonadota bacterium]|jgi:tripartite-type tricarboxylate transporter receptor subunit TctC